MPYYYNFFENFFMNKTIISWNKNLLLYTYIKIIKIIIIILKLLYYTKITH